ncbi:uncharacterized protein NECHADRAFT_87804 [Fusarium vanettenii 77-13-4]|uniref:Peptidase S1 domain-containing protein n=1 Tax=Fusarium vanettenii (strain ATCC MYA-4622 / CBS 123669 / FGSC 9596 / NRRL 45880 / 77-13-4) TaxID=660122 RepID=C7Z328_FUSV7|nr:uncharacterized protein NECHADRAFT_87804 [Fusarium vanettenii 77-13-4]EEU41586.1 predicted protein [Fusarium vanettenii 77-13-4]
MPRPSPPSDEEVRCYYVGLPGKPRLVARSSSDSWTGPQTDLGWTRGKTLDPVDPQHPIVALWNDSAGRLRQDFLEALDRIQWVAIDILRLGYQNVRGTLDETPLNPVTVLVSVAPNTTTWNVGVDVVLRCRDILRQHGIHDVEVEMKESKISQCNLGAKPVQEPQKLTSGPVAQPEESNALFSEFLGLSIAPLDSPYHEGTKGLYLRIRGTTRKLLLTCRHVAFAGSDDNKDFFHSGDAPRAIIQPGTGTLEEARRLVQADIRLSERDMETNRDLPWASAIREFDKAAAEKVAGEALEQRLSALEEPSNRTIGHVLFSPKISEGRSPSGEKRCRDWALVELNQEKHVSVLATLTNRVFCGMTGKNDTWRVTKAELEGCNPAQHYNLQFDDQTHTVELRGTVTKDTVATLPTESASLQDPALVVALYGSTTGLSVGVANEVKSVKRNLIGGTTFVSEEWCILGVKWRSGSGRGVFSERGDSGSCVWDMDGRIGGMLTGGLDGGNGSFDVSYATPIEWLLQDIREQSGLDVELA